MGEQKVDRTIEEIYDYYKQIREELSIDDK